MGGGGTLPTGTVTFLFTDIEGSTKLLQELGASYEAALSRHRELLRTAFGSHGGHEMGTEGDSFFVAFERAADGVAAALQAQIALNSHEWDHRPIRVRMGIHTGDAQLVEDDYVGLAVHQAARVSSAAHGGQVLVSQTTRDLVSGALPDGATLVDLGEHRLKDLAQPTRLYNLSHGSLQAELPPPRTLSVLPNNLPLQLTTFIGRESELMKIAKLLETTRLLSLLGAGGSGKTRLALQAGADLVTEYRDGVWLADLAPITDPDLVMRGFAEALGVREEKDRTIDDVLMEYLQGKQVLVIVDNCEHLAEASAEVIDRLLHSASELSVVATSREPIGAEGETVFRVPSLETPKGDEPVEVLATCEAIRLFCDRASRATAGFSLTSDNARPVSEICRRLDGMPLAIELAAARVRMLTPKEIAKRLDDRFKLLTGGVRTGLRRQQTLRAAVDWSYELLSEAEQLLFRRMSVFVGGFTLEAAEGVCSGNEIDELEVFDLLSNLVDRSLVLAEPHHDTTRYRMLETMREYGRETLAASREAQEVWTHHLGWFADLAEAAQVGLEGAEQGPWLERIDTELDNIRQALSWATSGGHACDGLRLAASLYRFWQIRFYAAEGLRWLEATFDVCSTPGLRAQALVVIGGMHWYLGNMREMKRCDEECVSLPRAPESVRWIAEATNDLGLVAWGLESDTVRGRQLLEEGLALRRQIGHRYGVAESLSNLVTLEQWEGNISQALRLSEEALRIRRELGADVEVAHTLMAAASFAELEGDFVRARDLNEEALDIARRMGDAGMTANALSALGAEERLQGDYTHARELVGEALQLCRDREIGGWMQGQTSRQLGHIALDQGDYAACRSIYEDALDKARESGSDLGIAFSQMDTAELARVQGDLETARSDYEQALASLRKGNDRINTPAALQRLGLVFVAKGDLHRGRTLLEEGLELARASGNRRHVASGLAGLGALSTSEGAYADAQTFHAEALRIRAASGMRPAIADSLERLGRLSVAAGRGERAAVLLGSAEELRETVGTVIDPVDKPEHDEALAKVKADLSKAAFDAAWAKGRALSVDEAVAYALDESSG